jgi:hypothetical protein
LHTICLPAVEVQMASQRTKARRMRDGDPPEPGREEVSIVVRGRTVRGVFSVADGWVEVIGDHGLTKTARCAESTANEVAERLLRELSKAQL